MLLVDADDAIKTSAVDLSMAEVEVSGGKKVLSSVADVDEFVQALRIALNTAINEGKRITR